MTALTIYGPGFSPAVRAARMTCVEKGVPFETELESLESLGRPEHLAVHPFRRLPAMRHDTVHLFETSAICRYIDGAFDGPPLQPETLVDHCLMDQWLSACNDYLWTDLVRGMAIPFAFPKGADGRPDMETVEAARPAAERDLRVLDKALEETGYLVAGRLTLADLRLAPMLAAVAGSSPYGRQLLDPYPAASAFLDRMSERDSFKRSAVGLSGPRRKLAS